ncbi:hypothetical protein [Nostoc sp.]|uniref:hypothetical protein n=1 Tax=Nostoc sp. TaxID=1180 RepID=UPI002FFA4A49
MSIEDICNKYSFTETFCVDNQWWGFERGSVMAVPFDRGWRKTVQWDDNHSPGYPFEIPEIYFREVKIPWNYKEVWDKPYVLQKICVRTDVYPLMWVFWWWYFRIGASLALIMRSLVYLLEIWGLAQTNSGEITRWHNIKFLSQLQKRLKSLSFSASIYDGGFWFRILGIGLSVVNREKHPPLFSQRNGFMKSIKFGKWNIAKLKNDPIN